MNRVGLIYQDDSVEVEISNRNALIPRIILGLFLLTVVGFPFIPVIFSLLSDSVNVSGSKGLLLPIVVWIIFILLISRFAFWGLWGKEIIQIGKNHLQVSYNYKFYKSKPRSYEGEFIDILFNQDDIDQRKSIGKVKFVFSESEYLTVLKISELDYKKIESYYRK